MTNVISMIEYKNRLSNRSIYQDDQTSNYDNITDGHPMTERLVSEIMQLINQQLVTAGLKTTHPNLLVIESALTELLDVEFNLQDWEIASDLIDNHPDTLPGNYTYDEYCSIIPNPRRPKDWWGDEDNAD